MRREEGREHRYYLHNTRYHSLINYGNVSSRGASITQRVSSSADSLAGRDLSFLLDCQQRSRILRVAQRVWWAWCSSGCMRFRESGAEKKRTNEKRYRNGQERFLETNVSDLTPVGFKETHRDRYFRSPSNERSLRSEKIWSRCRVVL